MKECSHAPTELNHYDGSRVPTITTTSTTITGIVGVGKSNMVALFYLKYIFFLPATTLRAVLLLENIRICTVIHMFLHGTFPTRRRGLRAMSLLTADRPGLGVYFFSCVYLFTKEKPWLTTTTVFYLPLPSSSKLSAVRERVQSTFLCAPIQFVCSVLFGVAYRIHIFTCRRGVSKIYGPKIGGPGPGWQ